MTDPGRISDDPEGWVVGWLRRIADDIEAGDWSLERHSQCWTRPFTDYEFTVALRVDAAQLRNAGPELTEEER